MKLTVFLSLLFASVTSVATARDQDPATGWYCHSNIREEHGGLVFVGQPYLVLNTGERLPFAVARRHSMSFAHAFCQQCGWGPRAYYVGYLKGVPSVESLALLDRNATVRRLGRLDEPHYVVESVTCSL